MNEQELLGKQIDELQENCNALLDIVKRHRELNEAMNAKNADLQAQVVYLKHQLSLAQAGQKDGRNV